MNRIIFLSHIHEEKDLAFLIQKAIEEEFSGFVKVFVSSDGSTIPAGANFLTRIEDGLIECIGGIYLISPKSIKRNWINFELGAIWIRNVLSQKNGDQELPIIPFCHSGMKISELPVPLNNLNAINADDSSHLKFAFNSIQKAVGASGNLRTDFNDLAEKVVKFQKIYTVVDNLISLFIMIGFTRENIPKAINALILKKANGEVTDNIITLLEAEKFRQIEKLILTDLSEYASIKSEGMTMNFKSGKSINGQNANITFYLNPILELEKELISKIKTQ